MSPFHIHSVPPAYVWRTWVHVPTKLPAFVSPAARRKNSLPPLMRASSIGQSPTMTNAASRNSGWPRNQLTSGVRCQCPLRFWCCERLRFTRWFDWTGERFSAHSFGDDRPPPRAVAVDPVGTAGACADSPTEPPASPILVIVEVPMADCKPQPRPTRTPQPDRTAQAQ